jgi:hypothetical protein
MARELVAEIKVVTTESMVSKSNTEEYKSISDLTVEVYPEKLITYEVDGRKVYCTIKTEDIEVTGVARCSDDDIFDLGEGCALAELRAKVAYAKELEERYVDVINNPFSQLMKALGQSLSY